MSDCPTSTLMRLPRSTAECDVGPIVEHRPGRAIMRYDSEGISEPAWTVLEFLMAIALRFTPDASCDPWMIAAYSQICEVVDSSWREALRDKAGANRLVFPASARHYFVYFDHVGCWEVLADDVVVVS